MFFLWYNCFMSGKRNATFSTVAFTVLIIGLVACTVIFLHGCGPYNTDAALTNGDGPGINSSQTPDLPPTNTTPALTPASTPPASANPNPPSVTDPSVGSTPPSSPSPTQTLPPPTPQVPSEDLTGELTINISDGKRASVLLDRDYNTRHVFRTGATIEISSDTEICSLYVIWSLPPGQWELAGTQVYDCGLYGFIHEYIPLSEPATVLTMSLPENGAALCDIYAFSEGVPPDWVQVWQPPLEKADLLVLPTHADDEHLSFVGILPYYAGELGYGVQVAYLTNHWNERPRPHELLNGLWTVGIRNYPVISDFRDRYAETLSQAISIYGRANIVDFQVELLRRFKPLVVVGHDLNGEYGHGVHMLNAHALLDAVEYAADLGYHEDSYLRYGLWDTPKLYLHLYRENSITLDWSIPLERFEGATAFDMAVAGYDCHKSQHRWSFRVPASGPRGHNFGLARSLVGNDITGGDLFENIDPDLLVKGSNNAAT